MKSADGSMVCHATIKERHLTNSLHTSIVMLYVSVLTSVSLGDAVGVTKLLNSNGPTSFLPVISMPVISMPVKSMPVKIAA